MLYHLISNFLSEIICKTINANSSTQQLIFSAKILTLNDKQVAEQHEIKAICLKVSMCSYWTFVYKSDPICRIYLTEKITAFK